MSSEIRQRKAEEVDAEAKEQGSSPAQVSEAPTSSSSPSDVLAPPTPAPASQSLAAYTVENVFWLLASMLCIYITEFPQVVLYDARVDRFWLHIGYAFAGVVATIGFYLILWLSVVKRVPSSRWEVVSPASIPTAAMSFSMASIAFLLALWPVYSWLTLPILFVLFMGAIVLVTLIPQFGAAG